MGNLTSVRNAFTYLGLECSDVRTAADMAAVSHLVLPGVGAFAAGMRRLEKLELVEALRHSTVVEKKPLLGICLGMQLFADTGNEFKGAPGLGFIAGSSTEIDTEESGLRLPHIGWNELAVRRESAVFEGIDDDRCFYFAHTFQLTPDDREAVVATCRYGVDVVAAVQRDNIFGVQFHPEKSQSDGLRLLKNFAVT